MGTHYGTAIVPTRVRKPRDTDEVEQCLVRETGTDQCLATATATALPASDPEPIFVGRDGDKPRVATADSGLRPARPTQAQSTIGWDTSGSQPDIPPA